MARSSTLEALVAADLAHLTSLPTKAMFGGLVWIWRGNLLCGADASGVLVRLGKGNDGWAVALPGIEPMMMGGRRMEGWVRLRPPHTEDTGLRRRLLTAAGSFVLGLPAK